MTAAIHIHPTAELAERILLPGDPGRALLLAQALLERPKMFNHNRGLWGYTGVAADGELLTVQSSGMGGPSAAIVLAELIDLGARRVLRVGTCGALDGGLSLGELVIVSESIARDGTSRELGAEERIGPSPVLLEALVGAADGSAAVGPVVSTDLFYDGAEGREQEWIAAGAVAVEMETATVFALARRRGIEAGAVLIVSDVVRPARRRIRPDELERAERRVGALAAGALAGG